MALRDLFTWRTYDPAEYTRSEILQKNEQIKTLSLFCNNAGVLVIAAGAAEWWKKGFDRDATIFLVSGAFVIAIAMLICLGLKAES
ncbi:MAG TPA: hypothetical protein VFW35_01115 [Sphingomicrobium sp.]|nr:hypothetical protein [Sphingomicrobium sp.]